MKLAQWVRYSFEGGDGKASSRKLTTFAFSLTTFILVFADLFFDLTVDPILLTGVLSMAGISLGLVTAQNIVDIFKRPQNSYYDNDIYNPHNRTTNSGDESITNEL
jgi:hypothetical protein